MATRPTTDHRSPYATAVAILTACAMTLIGIAVQNEPETILFRAVMAGLLTGAVTKSLIIIGDCIFDEDEL